MRFYLDDKMNFQADNIIRYIHGSEDSIDVDVFYVFDDMPSLTFCQLFCDDKNENRNIITIENEIVTNCFKGTIDEVNNGLYYTYSLHPQTYDLLVNRIVERDVLIKIIRVVRCILSHCSRTKYRDMVKNTLRSYSWKDRLKILRSIDFENINDFGKNGTLKDIYKIFAFQLGQVLGLLQGVELYTKKDISNGYPQLEKYLYRQQTDFFFLDNHLKIFLSYCESLEVKEKDEICYFKDFNKSIDLRREKYE